MGRTTECNLFVIQTEMDCTAAFNQGQALKSFDGRTRKEGTGKITRTAHHSAIVIGDYKGPAVAAFNEISTGDFGNDGIRHDA